MSLVPSCFKEFLSSEENTSPGTLSDGQSDNENLQVPVVCLPSDFELKDDVIIAAPLFIYTEEDDCNEETGECQEKAILGNVVVRSKFVTFKNLKFNGAIDVQTTDNTSSLTLELCELNLKKGTREHAIKVGQKSKLIVKKSKFINLERTGIYANQYSHVEVYDSVFVNFIQSAIIMNQFSSSFIKNTTFKNVRRSSIFLNSQATCDIDHCTFSGYGDHTISINQGAKANITFTKFQDLDHHGIYVMNKGELNASKLSFKNITFAGIYLCNSSKGDIKQSEFNDMPGNAILLNNSSLKIDGCHFRNIDGPVLTVTGHESSAEFLNSSTKTCKSHAFILKDASAPVFDNLAISNVSGHCFSISAFSRPLIKKCVINKCGNSAFSVFNGAAPLITKNTITNSVFLDTFSCGMPLCSQNHIYCENTMKASNLISIHHRGAGEFAENNLCILDGKQQFSVFDGKLTLLGDIPLKAKENLRKPADLEHLYQEITKQEWKEHIQIMSEGNIDLNQSVECFGCHSKKSEVFLIPCGHKIFCEECANHCQICPLCQMPVESITHMQKSENDHCLTCGHLSDCISLPCGHLSKCYGCSSIGSSSTKICPTCKKPITATSPLFVL